MKAVEKGLKGEALPAPRLLEEKEPLELVDEALIPALDIVGAKMKRAPSSCRSAGGGHRRAGSL